MNTTYGEGPYIAGSCATRLDVAMEIIISLTDAQVQALNKTGVEDAQSLVEKAAASVIRGKFKYYASSEKEQLGRMYDAVITRGGIKTEESKPAFIQRLLSETSEILAEL